MVAIDSYLTKIADDWIFTYSQHEIADESRNPWTVVEIIARYDPSYSWFLFEEIFALDVEGKSLPMLVAGPFQTWVECHAESEVIAGANNRRKSEPALRWIDILIYEATNEPRIRWALGGLSQASLDPVTWARIEHERESSWTDDGPLPPNK
jgi:hypothetical protein